LRSGASEHFEIAEYGAHIGVATSLAYRRRDAFRKCFPRSDALEIWGNVRTSLKRSNFAHEHPLGQAVYLGSMVAQYRELSS
jgi:hypothetical protein